ncbi:hypothetical protein HYH03_004291 [Edaphochlamys debaryana]|uniref:Uncharacterized protein n=1 Tax=Edaphochlamys debaryana TaxID=47281 RepID=A0A836C3C7_9CHLO|nr:hypothetical protein HYH03_004291 [Edaphochlamys debaryana]|eukprot:KAG2497544.1 hypothetical protein HYH03_004291 [Edaphochlamys debaryana]
MQTDTPRLPPQFIAELIPHLGPRTLARIASLDKESRFLVCQREDVWRGHCLCRWPTAQPAPGTWRQLYGDMAAASTFRAEFEEAQACTHAAMQLAGVAPGLGRGQLAALFERFAQALHSLGQAAAAYRSVRACSAFARLQGQSAWWLTEHPQVLVRFARDAHALLLDLPPRGLPHLGRMWTTQLCWRRSALAFALEAPRPPPPALSADAAAEERLRAEVAALDRTLLALHRAHPAALSSPQPPPGPRPRSPAAACANGDAPEAGAGRGPGPGGASVCFDDLAESWLGGGGGGVGRGGGGSRGGALMRASAGGAGTSGAEAGGPGGFSGGLLGCRRLQAPPQHWWAWLPDAEGEGPRGQEEAGEGGICTPGGGAAVLLGASSEGGAVQEAQALAVQEAQALA